MMNQFIIKVRLTIALLAITAMTSAAQTKRYLGGDMSLLPSYEEQGTVYKDYDGKKVDLLSFLRQQGWNMVRVRLFVNPDNAPEQHKGEGVCQDLEYVTRLCRQIKKAGMQVMLDFHYSDTWADPGKQFTPKAWADADARQLADSVYAHTRASLTALERAGVAPEMIQVGNEITNGMLWPTGQLYPKDAPRDSSSMSRRWDILCDFLKAGAKACREICPKAQIIIHTEKAGDWDVTSNYYQQLRRRQVDYDIIGLSYYPMWHKSIPNLAKNLERLARLFPEKPVMIVETGFYIEDETLAETVMADFFSKTKNLTQCAGIFYWEPEVYNWWKPSYYTTLGWNAYNRGAFKSNGRPAKTLNPFLEAALTTITTPTTTHHLSPITYYNLQGQPLAAPTHGIIIEKSDKSTRKVINK